MSKTDDLEFHHCPDCFVHYAMPIAMGDARRADGKTFYCPNGHRLSYKDNEQDRIRRERDKLKQDAARLEDEKRQLRKRADELRDERDAETRRVSAAKGRITRMKNRSATGHCPCCNRVFVDLLSHMKSKHADYEAEPVDLDAETVQ